MSVVRKEELPMGWGSALEDEGKPWVEGKNSVPLFQTEYDLLYEELVAQYLSERKFNGKTLYRFSDDLTTRSAVDRYIEENGVHICHIEIKGRDIRRETYGEIFFEVQKCADMLTLPAVKDGLWYSILAKQDGRILSLNVNTLDTSKLEIANRGGRTKKTRPDAPRDITPCYLVPIEAFEEWDNNDHIDCLARARFHWRVEAMKAKKQDVGDISSPEKLAAIVKGLRQEIEREA